jgi:hypothetical protein
MSRTERRYNDIQSLIEVAKQSRLPIHNNATGQRCSGSGALPYEVSPWNERRVVAAGTCPNCGGVFHYFTYGWKKAAA